MGKPFSETFSETFFSGTTFIVFKIKNLKRIFKETNFLFILVWKKTKNHFFASNVDKKVSRGKVLFFNCKNGLCVRLKKGIKWMMLEWMAPRHSIEWLLKIRIPWAAHCISRWNVLCTIRVSIVSATLGSWKSKLAVASYVSKSFRAFSTMLHG